MAISLRQSKKHYKNLEKDIFNKCKIKEGIIHLTQTNRIKEDSNGFKIQVIA